MSHPLLRSPLSRRAVPVILVFCVGITLSFAAFVAVQQYEQERIQGLFERQARNAVIAFQRSVDSYIDTLRAISHLYTASQDVERREFREFVQGVFANHPSFQALEWIPRVPHSQRAAYEAATRAEGYPDFALTERGTKDRLVKAEKREEYFPVHYVEPFANNKMALGFDHGSQTTRRKAMDKARDTGRPAATARTRLFRQATEAGEQFAVIVFLPVYQKDAPTENIAQRRRALSGFAAAVFHLNLIVVEDLKALGLASDVKVAFIDESVPDNEQLLLLSTQEAVSPAQAARLRDRVHWIIPLEVAGQSWSLLLAPTSQWVGAYTTWRSAQTLMVGVGGALLLVMYLAALARRASQVEQMVGERTTTLSHINQELESEVAERRRTEEALRESERRARLIVNTAHDAFVAIDMEGLVVEWNLQAELTFGWARHEVLGRSIVDRIVPSRYREAHQGEIQRFLQTGEGMVLDKRLELSALHRDGREFPVELTISPIRHAQGYTFNAFIRDVTDRHQAEEAMSQLAAIVESSDDAIVSETLEGVIVTWNSGAEKIYGYAAEEIVGSPVSLLIPPDRAGEEQQILERTTCGESVDQYETVRVRKNGTSIDVSLTISPVKDATGKVTGASVIARDITEHRAVERMKEEFISVVSHELRTPLTSIRGSLGLLANGVLGVLPEKGQRMLEIAVNNADRLVHLINDILDIERMESGKITLRKQACEAATVMTQAVEVMQGMADKGKVALAVSPGDVRFWADPDHIVRTLTNLLSNAIKFSPPGGTIQLSAQRRNKEVVVAVADHGRGVPADKLENIFGRFQQVDASDSRDKGGTGLGLAICRSIVQQHGGRIWAESEVGKGSTFFFSLPALENKSQTSPGQVQDKFETSLESVPDKSKGLKVENPQSTIHNRIYARALQKERTYDT